jgi:hypothetical protein
MVDACEYVNIRKYTNIDGWIKNDVVNKLFEKFIGSFVFFCDLGFLSHTFYACVNKHDICSHTQIANA